MIAFGGIDPGCSGAMAILDSDGNPFQVFDYPGDPVSLWRIFNDQFFRSLDMKLVVLEQAAIMPMEKEGKWGNIVKRQGAGSLAKFHQNYGIWWMSIVALGWPTEISHPMRWRKVLDSSVPLHPSKDDLLNCARRRFPGVDLHRKADHNRAEALLIASYARLKHFGQIT
jgi:crossover junction endodeoxyribonuclease RuvC